MTSSRLRELSRLASPAPWKSGLDFTEVANIGTLDIGSEFTYIKRGDRLIPRSGRLVANMTGPQGGARDSEALNEARSTANVRLVVALRNDAEKYADLRDAAKALMDNVDSREKGLSGYYIDAQRFVALRAALAALGGEE